MQAVLTSKCILLPCRCDCGRSEAQFVVSAQRLEYHLCVMQVQKSHPPILCGLCHLATWTKETGGKQ